MALQKVDAVIAGVGAVALLATVLGVVFYEELAGEQEITFPTSDVALTAQEGASGTPLNFALPDNATHATLAVEVVFSGQAGQGGSATIQVDMTGPGDFVGTASSSMAIAPGDTTGTVTFEVPEFAWATVPEPVTAEPGSIDETQSWDEDLVVTVTVTPPADALGAIPGGAISYSFQATVTPTVSVYEAFAEIPEVETA